MCDYSLHNVKSRPAKVGDKLTTHHFNTGTRGFAAPEDANTAVCVLPGTDRAGRLICKLNSVQAALDWAAYFARQGMLNLLSFPKCEACGAQTPLPQ